MSYYIKKARQSQLMARKTTNTSRRRKFARTTRRPHTRPSGPVIRQLGISDKMLVKLKYIETANPTIALTATTNNFQTFNINSIVQPNALVAASNTAMPYASEYSQFYNRFRVNFAKVTFEAVNTATSPIYMFMHVQDDAIPATFGTWAQIRKFEGNRYTRFKLLGNNAGMNKGTISIAVNLARYNGNTTAYRGDLSYCGQTGGVNAVLNPGRLFETYLGFMSADGSVATATFPIHVTIKFYTEYFDRIDLVQ